MRFKLLERCSVDTIYRVIFYLLGCILISLGVVISILSGFGTGAWDAVNTGLFNVFGYSVGLWVNINAVLLIIVSGLLLGRFPRLTTLITSFICATFIDIFIILLIDIHVDTPILGFLTCILGIITLSLGAAMYLVTNFPPSPIDYFMMCVKERFNISIGLAKTISDGIGIIIAFFIKGPIGIGTVLMLFLLGPLIQFLYKYTNTLFNYLRLGKVSSSSDEEQSVDKHKNTSQ